MVNEVAALLDRPVTHVTPVSLFIRRLQKVMFGLDDGRIRIKRSGL